MEFDSSYNGYPRWRIRFICGSNVMLYAGIWHRTQEAAELHAIWLLEIKENPCELYDIEYEAAPT